MNSCLIAVHHNDPNNFIEEPEYFSSITADSYVNTNTNPLNNPYPDFNAQLYGGSKSHVFTNITMLTYIIPKSEIYKL